MSRDGELLSLVYAVFKPALELDMARLPLP